MSRQRRRAAPQARIPSRWRKAVFVVLLAALVAANVVLLRRQFPPASTVRNAAYDRGLVAMSVTNPKRDFAAAEVEFRRCLSILDETRVRELLAITLRAQGKTAEARDEFLAVLERDPGMDRSRVGLAEIAETEQDYDEAFRQLDLAAADPPTPVDVFLVRARILGDLGDIDGAIATYRRALAQDGASFDAHLGIADLLTLRNVLDGSEGDLLAAAGSYREAETLLRAQITRTTDSRLRMALARAIAGQSRILGRRDLSEAARQLTEVAAADPADPAPTLLLARFFADAGNAVEARRTFEDAAVRWPLPRTIIALHEFLAAAGDTARAAQVLEDGISKNRLDLPLRVRLISFLVTSGRMDDAERELSGTETILSEDWRVHEIRGDLAREKSRIAASDGRREDAESARGAALAAYRRALAGRPRSPRLKKKIAAQLIEGVFRRGTGTGEPTADERFARQCIEDVLRLNRTDSEALEWQARLYLAEGRPTEAAKLLRPLVEAPQPTITALRLLGAAAARIGDDGSAADAWVRVLSILAPEEASGRRTPRNATPDDWCAATEACVSAGRGDLAARIARDGAAAWPESPRVAAALVSAYLAQNDVTSALDTVTAARTRFPADTAIRLALARALEVAGRTDEAAAEFEGVASEAGTEEARLLYLDFLVRTGRLASAEKGFLELIAADPSNPAARLRLGDFHLAARPPKRDAALREYEEARRLDPASPEPLLRLADVRLADAAGDPAAIVAVETTTGEFERLAPGDVHLDYLRGKIALAAGRVPEAVERLTRFAAAKPDRSAAQYYLAVALRAAGRAADSLEPMQRAAKLAPADDRVRAELATLHFDLGVQAFQAGDWEAAKRLFARADAGTIAADARLLIAGAAANAGQSEAGEAACRALLAGQPGHRSARHLLALLLLAKHSREAAAEAGGIYQALLDEDPADLMARLGAGTVKFQTGFIREALDDFRRAYPRTRSSPDVALAICQCWAALGSLQEAVDFLDAEAAANPGSWDFPHLKGDFLVSLKQTDLALAAFAEAERRDPKNPGPPLAAASAMVQAGRLEEARQHLVERQERTSDPATFAVALGDVLARMSRIDEAQESLRRALALRPGHPRALYLLGRIAENAGRAPEAKRLYREAVERGVPDGDCWARLARLHAAEPDWTSARDAWAGALRLAPRNPVYLNNYALVLARDPARADEALRAAATAAGIAPERGEIADTHGWLLLRAGRLEEAVPILLRAAALLETNAEVQFHAGIARSRTGRLPEARAHLERALRIDPAFPGADEARAELDRIR